MTPLKLRSIDGIELDAALHRSKVIPARGTVIQVHGITADMDEGGMFVRLADGLAAAGSDVLRFSFRGHGRSGGTQRGVTIAGEMLDLQAVVAAAQRSYAGPLSVVAASFGAVPLIWSLPYLADRLDTLVLWNPVLDLRKTFVDPDLPWGRKNFTGRQLEHLEANGFLLVDGDFELGQVLYVEMQHDRTAQDFLSSRLPALVIHGDQDTYVSFEIARRIASQRANCSFHSVSGSDHGFDGRDHEDEAIRVTIDWLGLRSPVPL